jgi:hypothetical protein
MVHGKTATGEFALSSTNTATQMPEQEGEEDGEVDAQAGPSIDTELNLIPPDADKVENDDSEPEMGGSGSEQEEGGSSLPVIFQKKLQSVLSCRCCSLSCDLSLFSRL